MYNIVKLRNTKQFVSWKFWTIGGRGVEIFYERKMTMKANTKNKKNNTIKKIVPAAGMLALSASMLATSTYAWFTMSREVTVENIQMVATVPEDIQISLGDIASSSETITLSKSTGILTHAAGVVAAPEDSYDWSNTADISKYYQFGKLIPASSATGENIYFTNAATGVGRTLGSETYFQACDKTGAFEYASATTNFTSDGGGDSAKATAYIDQTSAADSVDPAWVAAGGETYTKADSWYETNSDGYYIDIPVWLRTSSQNAQTLYVTGYVTDRTAETATNNPQGTADSADEDDLYKAVRVAIIGGETDNTAGIKVGEADKGCLTLKDAGSDPEGGSFFTALSQITNATNINDSGNFNTSTVSSTVFRCTDDTIKADSKVYAINSTTAKDDGTGHAEITQNNGSNTNSVVVLPASTSNTEFGVAKKLIIRVWLEGEDINCWNENAGQDWNIALKFTKDALA